MEELLVIEDDINIRESLKEILELAGYRVETAVNGKEGFDSIVSKFPDLVICDINMPELDGFELLKAIDQRFHDSLIPPFIFLTAKVENQDIRRGMSLGADDYILKPFDHIHLLEVIRMRLDKRKKLVKTEPPASVNNANREFTKIALPSDEGLLLVNFNEIIKCQADRSYCRFHLVKRKPILVSKSMKEFEDILSSNGFLKVHKSTIVNLQHAEKYLKGNGGQLIMSDGSMVPVSVRKKEVLLSALQKF